MMAQLRKLLMHLQPAKPALPSPDIGTCEHGIWELRGQTPRYFIWEEVVSVKIVWSENPWGDPFCGPYCDTEWLVESRSGERMFAWDDEQTRRAILPAFEKYLPGYSFDYISFDEAHKGRTFQLDGGEHLTWSRAGKAQLEAHDPPMP